MAGVNKVILIGNVTRDPELRYTPKGRGVLDLGLAVNRKYRVEEELREEVVFVDITFWGQQAETISKYVTKGKSIYIEGRLRLDQWDDKTSGQKRSQLRVEGENFQFLGGPGGGSGGGGGASYASDSGGESYSRSAPPRQQQAPQRQEPSSGGPQFLNEEEDDIPF